MKYNQTTYSLFAKCISVGLALTLTACSTTQQADKATPSGFLRSYSLLSPGEGDQALLRYVDNSAPWGRYNKIMIDPIAIYSPKDSDLREDASREQQKALAEYFAAALREELGKDYAIVSTPGPDVLRVRAAISDADSSEPLLNFATTAMPIGLALSTLKRSVSGSDSFVGSAQAEIEITDSVSRSVIGAAVDKRYGTKALRTKFGGGWSDAKYVFDYWAEQVRERLEELKKNG